MRGMGRESFNAGNQEAMSSRISAWASAGPGLWREGGVGQNPGVGRRMEDIDTLDRIVVTAKRARQAYCSLEVS